MPIEHGTIQRHTQPARTKRRARTSSVDKRWRINSAAVRYQRSVTAISSRSPHAELRIVSALLRSALHLLQLGSDLWADTDFIFTNAISGVTSRSPVRGRQEV